MQMYIYIYIERERCIHTPQSGRLERVAPPSAALRHGGQLSSRRRADTSYIYIYICIYTYAYIYLYLSLYIFIYVCMYVCVCMYW